MQAVSACIAARPRDCRRHGRGGTPPHHTTHILSNATGRSKELHCPASAVPSSALHRWFLTQVYSHAGLWARSSRLHRCAGAAARSASEAGGNTAMGGCSDVVAQDAPRLQTHVSPLFAACVVEFCVASLDTPRCDLTITAVHERPGRTGRQRAVTLRPIGLCSTYCGAHDVGDASPQVVYWADWGCAWAGTECGFVVLCRGWLWLRVRVTSALPPCQGLHVHVLHLRGPVRPYVPLLDFHVVIPRCRARPCREHELSVRQRGFLRS